VRDAHWRGHRAEVSRASHQLRGHEYVADDAEGAAEAVEGPGAADKKNVAIEELD
jgi:hypothetical protein